MLSDNQRLKEEALKCVVKFVELFYEHLEEWIELIWKATADIIKSSEKELAILAIEVWTAIAGEEARLKDKVQNVKKSLNKFVQFPNQEKNLNIIQNSAPLLFQVLVPNLLNAEKYNDTTEDYETYEYEAAELTVNTATQACLENIAMAIEEAEGYFVKFIDGKEVC